MQACDGWDRAKRRSFGTKTGEIVPNERRAALRRRKSRQTTVTESSRARLRAKRRSRGPSDAVSGRKNRRAAHRTPSPGEKTGLQRGIQDRLRPQCTCGSATGEVGTEKRIYMIGARRHNRPDSPFPAYRIAFSPHRILRSRNSSNGPIESGKFKSRRTDHLSAHPIGCALDVASVQGPSRAR